MIKFKEQKQTNSYVNNITNEEINLLKIELDNKTNELNSKNALYKEQITAITMFQNENEKLKEKNDLLNEKIIFPIKVFATHKTDENVEKGQFFYEISWHILQQ